MKRHLVSLLAFAFAFLSVHAIDYRNQVRIHCENDTAFVNRLLVQLQEGNPSLQERVVKGAESFLGVPYVPSTLEGEEEKLTIRTDGVDCTTFVDNVIALAKASEKSRPTWRHYAEILENLRYRKGEMKGYPSRLHYVSDWIAENIYRGNVKELTEDFQGSTFQRMTLDYMTRHPEKYPALNDASVLEEIKMVEMGYRAHKVPYLKKETITRKDVTEELQDGDIIIIVPRETGLDASHMGFVKKKDGVVNLLHASSKEGKVTVSEESLQHYFKHQGRTSLGYRILRVTD